MKLTINAIKVFTVVLLIIYVPLAFSLWEPSPAKWPVSARVASVVLFLIAVATMVVVGTI